jgi:hypothetical protein
MSIVVTLVLLLSLPACGVPGETGKAAPGEPGASGSTVSGVSAAAVTSAAASAKVAATVPAASDHLDIKDQRAGELISESTDSSEDEQVKILQKSTVFGNGDMFWIRRYLFKHADSNPYTSSFTIPGESIRVHYVTAEGGEKKWATTLAWTATFPKATLFISTSEYSLIIGIPSVYKAQGDSGHLDVQADIERPVSIVKEDGQYVIRFSFEQDPKYIGEIWALQSNIPLFEMNEWDQRVFMGNDLADQWRLSMEGYYQKTYANYRPTGPHIYFRQASCYAGGSLLRARGSNAAYDLGYVLMKLSAANQKEAGYFTTPSRSDWLYTDFGIQEDFYDTRFNTDFAANLLDAYTVYGDGYFLESAKRYGEFYVNYAAENSYQTENGILVADYWQEAVHKKTHVSLNHHLAGLNFMLRMYHLTAEQAYADTALLMSKGIEDTEAQWLLPDGNLAYAVHYTGDNLMQDYPYLTYNDLYWADWHLENYVNVDNGAVQRLMASKKAWMIKNGVHGYYGEK